MGIFIVYGLLFYIGAIFCRDHGLTLEKMLQSLFGIIFASFAGGNAGFFMPDI
jgi:ATP-binding cassette subfamily B (MDR/TAP) protein 1